MFLSFARAAALVVLLAVSGCAGKPGPGVPSGAVDPAALPPISLKDLCRRFDADWHLDSLTQVVTITTPEKTIEALVGSDVVIAGDEKIILSAPVAVRDSQIIVPPDFVRVMAPAPADGARAHPSRSRIRKARAVVIDAGHGGKDPGALRRAGGLDEKEITLDIARRVRDLLKRGRVRVVMTREKDEFVPLEQRAELASRVKADLFVSIHANSHPKPGVYGVEVYTLKGLTAYEMKDPQRRASQRLYLQGLRMAPDKPEVESIIEELLYSHKQAESAALARKLGAPVARQVKTRDLGVKESRFFVLRNTVVPAVLIEVGFLSNPREERQLATASYRQRLAEGIARSILSYIDD
jgi:N-acetylmuramoyl-L-alanine amidase